MTKPRTSIHRLLLGYLGRDCSSADVLRRWNAKFRAHRLDASMDRYPCTVAKLPERLSEMLHFDRRGYILASPLRKAALPLMDALDASAARASAVDTVINEGGIFTGFFLSDDDEARWKLWRIGTLLS